MYCKIASISLDRHRSAGVGAKHLDASGPQPGEHGRGRMTVPVAPPHADDRHLWRERVEERRAGATGRPVVTDLQHLHRSEGRHEGGLRRKPDVPGEQRIETTVREVEHERVLVGHRPLGHPGRSRVQECDRDRIEAEGIPGSSRHPPYAVLRHQVVHLLVECRPHRLTRLHDEAAGDPLEHRGHPAKVIGVGVRHQHGLQIADTEAGEGRRHDPGPGVETDRARPAVNEHGAPPGRPDHDGVPLAHVQRDHHEAVRARQGKRAGE